MWIDTHYTQHIHGCRREEGITGVGEESQEETWVKVGNNRSGRRLALGVRPEVSSPPTQLSPSQSSRQFCCSWPMRKLRLSTRVLEFMTPKPTHLLLLFVTFGLSHANRHEESLSAVNQLDLSHNCMHFPISKAKDCLR